MNSKALKRILGLSMAFLMMASIMVGCGSSSNGTTTKDPSAPVTIKFFSNLPDRSSGQGKLEQTLIDNYMNENKNVKIELEILQDEPYKQKFKTYLASNNLPDIFNAWGQTAFLTPAINANLLAELNPADYNDYTFNKGSLNAFSANGKLYGLPRNQDMINIYYNKAIFDKAGVKIPTTFQELIAASKALRAKGITPCSINGKDKWALNLLFQDIAVKVSGDQSIIYNAQAQKESFATNPSLIKAADYFKQLMDAKFFQDSFTSADYGAARNLFGQEKTAMYYMGAWEMGLATDEKLPQHFRDNLGVMVMPPIEGEAGKVTDYVAWNGGGYAVAANSKVKAEAIKLLNYMFKPENWTKIGWQTGAVTPAQDFKVFFTGKETEVQKQIADILSNATSMSGTSWNDSMTPGFKTDSETLAQELAAGIKTPAQFLKGCDDAVARALAK